MNKLVKEFTIESWVTGEPCETLYRISLSQLESDKSEILSLPEAQSKLQKLQKQYYELLELNRSLEEQQYNLQCQIRALQVSNIYANDISNKIPEKRLEFTDKEVETYDSNDQTAENVNKRIYLQQKVIDDLMCKLQNMHNRIEYFKDDVTELKSQYNKERQSVEVEKKYKTVAFEQFQESLHQIKTLQEENSKLRLLVDEKKTSTIIETKTIYEKSNYQIDNEHNLIEYQLREQIKGLKKQYATQLLRTQQNNSITIENLAATMKKKMDDLRNFYEFRILSMIQDFSFEEGKFSSKILTLSNQISEQISVITELEQKLKVYELKFNLGQDNQKQARGVIRNLQLLVNSISLDKVAVTSKSSMEIDLIMKQMEDTQSDMKHDFYFQMKIAEKSHADALVSLKKTYESKIDRINQEFDESLKKIQAKERSEAVILMAEISRLEQEKTYIEMTTESRVQDVVREAKSRYQEYEHLIDYSKKQLLDQWNNDRKALIETHETEIKNLKTQFSKTLNEKIGSLTGMYEEKIQDIEFACTNKLKTLNKKYTDEIMQLKDSYQNEIIQINSQNEILRNEANIVKCRLEEVIREKDEIFQKFGVELDEERIKSAEIKSRYDSLLTVRLKEKSELEDRISSISQALGEREKVLKVKFESEKNVIVNHVLSEKYELESHYNKKVLELNKKLENLKEKYIKVKEKKTVIRINDSNPQRLNKELQEKDRQINQLIKEKTNLQASLDYMNSTMRIFSSQEKTFHTKSNSSDSKTPKSSVRNSRYSRF